MDLHHLWFTSSTSQTKKYGPPQQKSGSLSRKKAKKYVTSETTGKVKKQPDSSTHPSPTWFNTLTEKKT
jgi:hypothetical protein